MTKLPKLLTLFGCLSLASCIEVEMDGKIEQGGSGTLELAIIGPDSSGFKIGDAEIKSPTQTELDKKAAEKLTKLRDKSKASGFEITALTITKDGGRETEKTTVKFDNIEELNAYFKASADKDDTDTVISLEESGSSGKFSFVMKTKDDKAKANELAMVKGMLGDAKMKLKWTLPGNVKSVSEGGKIDGKTATWEVPFTDMFDKGINVSAEYGGMSKTVLAGGLVVGLLAIGSVFVFRKKKA